MAARPVRRCSCSSSPPRRRSRRSGRSGAAPARDGRIPGTLALSWPKALKPGWKVPIGIGYSSPVVAGQRVFTFARNGENEVAASLDLATGKPIWTQSYPAPYNMNSAARSHGKGPKSTPVVQDGRLFTLGISRRPLGVRRADGPAGLAQGLQRAVPQRRARFRRRDVARGRGRVAPRARRRRRRRRADARSTRPPATVRWAWKGDGPAYASPVVADIGGVRQVVTQTQKQLVGLSLAKGELLWSLPFTTPYEQNSVTPVVSGDVVIYSGLDQGLQAVRVVRKGAGWATEPAWQTNEVSLYMSSPVLDGGRLYGFSHRNKGQYFAVDAATGKTLWLGEGRQGDNAAVLVGPRRPADPHHGGRAGRGEEGRAGVRADRDLHGRRQRDLGAPGADRGRRCW